MSSVPVIETVRVGCSPGKMRFRTKATFPDFVIEVQPVPVKHRVRVAALVSYLNSLGKPRDAGEKVRLRQIVQGCGLGIAP